MRKSRLISESCSETDRLRLERNILATLLKKTKELDPVLTISELKVERKKLLFDKTNLLMQIDVLQNMLAQEKEKVETLASVAKEKDKLDAENTELKAQLDMLSKQESNENLASLSLKLRNICSRLASIAKENAELRKLLTEKDVRIDVMIGKMTHLQYQARSLENNAKFKERMGLPLDSEEEIVLILDQLRDTNSKIENQVGLLSTKFRDLKGRFEYLKKMSQAEMRHPEGVHDTKLRVADSPSQSKKSPPLSIVVSDESEELSESPIQSNEMKERETASSIPSWERILAEEGIITKLEQTGSSHLASEEITPREVPAGSIPAWDRIIAEAPSFIPVLKERHTSFKEIYVGPNTGRGSLPGHYSSTLISPLSQISTYSAIATEQDLDYIDYKRFDEDLWSKESIITIASTVSFLGVNSASILEGIKERLLMVKKYHDRLIYLKRKMIDRGDLPLLAKRMQQLTPEELLRSSVSRIFI